MNVLVDSSVWSLAFRRQKPDPAKQVAELFELILEGRAQLIGPVRQEVLSGIRSDLQFQQLRDALRGFPDLEILTADFELAAAMFSQCRRQGIQGSNTDFLICAVAERLHMPILTTDVDFRHFAEHISVRLHPPRAGLALPG